MPRTRLAAATVISLSLLAPVAGASAAAAAPQECGFTKQLRDHKKNKGKAHRKGHDKPRFVHHGKVTAVDLEASTVTFVVRGGQKKFLRGCELTVEVADGTRLKRNGKAAELADFADGDRVRAKGTTARTDTDEVTYTAKRLFGSSKAKKA